jgi:outer membrane protein OmpA-like peptidoglycan-associated protein
MKYCTAIVVASMVAGCASTAPTKEIADANAAYLGAASGPAHDLDPAGLDVANARLQAAMESFRAEGDTYRTRDLAYVAMRKAQEADSRARALELVQKVNLAEQQVRTTQAEQATSVTGQARLEAETQRREAAEEQAQRSLSDLHGIATVREDSRGTVITLSGGMLFTSGDTELLPIALPRLKHVADALAAADPNSIIKVCGFTDSEGTDGYNLWLSRRRAQVVKKYLIEHGVSPERVSSLGFGRAQPVASNRTSDGRAMNRRVEIVLAPPTTKSAASTRN